MTAPGTPPPLLPQGHPAPDEPPPLTLPCTRCGHLLNGHRRGYTDGKGRFIVVLFGEWPCEIPSCDCHDFDTRERDAG